jgi:hypothetical protein
MEAHRSNKNCEIPLQYPGNPAGFALDVTVVTEERPDLFEWYLGL